MALKSVFWFADSGRLKFGGVADALDFVLQSLI